MSVINLTNIDSVLNLPITNIASLVVKDVSSGIITSSNGVISSIPSIDETNLSISLQTRLNSLDSGLSSISISDVSGLQSKLNTVDSSFNTLSITNVSGLQSKLNTVDSSFNTLSITNVSGLQSKLNTIDSSFNTFSITNVSGLQSKLNTIDSSFNTFSITNVSGLQSKLNTVDSSFNTLGITNVSGLQSKLNTVDASLNALSSGSGGSTTVRISDVSGLQPKLNTIDSSLNILNGISKLALSNNSTNITSFGSNWSQLVNSPNDNGVGMAASGNGQYVMKLGWGAASYLSNDYGNTWSSVSSLGSFMWSASMSNNGQYILATTIVGSSQLSSDYGINWTYLSSIGSPNDCKVSSSGQFMVIASSNGIYYSSNYGQSFTNWTDSNTNTWNSVAISSDGKTSVAIRATSPTTVWKTENYGQTWTQIYSNPSSISFGTISCSDDIKYILLSLAQSQSGNMYLSNNYGSSFAALASGTGLSSSTYFRTSISSSGMYMLAACNTGNVFSSINYGQTWTQTNLPSSFYYGVSISTNGSLAYAYIPGTRFYAFNSNVISLPTSQISTPGRGSIYFDQSSNKLFVYNTSSSSWKSVTLA